MEIKPVDVKSLGVQAPVHCSPHCTVRDMQEHNDMIMAISWMVINGAFLKTQVEKC